MILNLSQLSSSRMTRIFSRISSLAPYAWSTSDQAIAGVGNALLLSQLARGMDAASFGEVGFVYTIVLLVVSAFRASTSDIVLSLSRTDQRHEIDDAPLRPPILIVAIVCVIAGALIEVLIAPSAIGLMVMSLGVILIQDKLRYEWICRKLVKRAFYMDASWFFFQVALLFLLGDSILHPKPAEAIGAWTAGALLSLVFSRHLLTRLDVSASMEWVRTNYSKSLTSGGQSLVVNGATIAPIVIFGILREPHWIGAFVVANSVTGIQPLVTNGIRPLAFRKFADDERTHHPRALLRMCGLASIASLLAGLISIVIMEAFGHTIYGTAATIGIGITYWIVLKQIVGTSSMLLLGVLRARGRWTSGLSGEILTTIISFTLMLAAGLILGAEFVIPFQLIGSVVSLGIWSVLVSRSRRETI